MFRGDRLFLLALAGLALLGITFGLGVMIGTSEQAQKYRYQSYRYAGDKPQDADSTLAGQASAQALGYRTPCDQQKGQGESELCAQWKAALAAEDSAAWANWALWVSAIGIAALVWQIGLTRRAMQDTGLALDIARRTADVAHDGHKAFVESERGHLKLESAYYHTAQGLCFRVRNIGSATLQIAGVMADTESGWPDEVSGPMGDHRQKIANGDAVDVVASVVFADGQPHTICGYVSYATLGLKDRRAHFTCSAILRAPPSSYRIKLLPGVLQPHDT